MLIYLLPLSTLVKGYSMKRWTMRISIDNILISYGRLQYDRGGQ